VDFTLLIAHATIFGKGLCSSRAHGPGVSNAAPA
jgi:hypothetical protein